MTEKNAEQSIFDKSMRSVFVGNIPYDSTEDQLMKVFSEVGPVLSLKLVVDRDSGKPNDQETALCAMRNLNGYEIAGRVLRVDNACTEKSRMEMQQLLQGPRKENPYGDDCDPNKAPEIIAKKVASMPPQELFELTKQTKQCIQNDPSEARQMLLKNPQLAYALLQSLVVQEIVDPQTALTMLFKPNQMPPVLRTIDMTGQPQHHTVPLTQQAASSPSSGSENSYDMQKKDFLLGDPRSSDPRPSNNLQPGSSNSHPVHVPTAAARDPRRRQRDPRLRPANHNEIKDLPHAPQKEQPKLPSRPPSKGTSSDACNQEKDALLMQVLQLSDEQIAKLSSDKRSSIMFLKESVMKMTQGRSDGSRQRQLCT